MTYDRGEGSGEGSVSHAYRLLTGEKPGDMGEMLEGKDPGYNPEEERKYRDPLRGVIEEIVVSVTGKEPVERIYAQP